MTLATNGEFDPNMFLAKAGAGHSSAEFAEGQIVFGQGDPADAVYFIRQGKIKITVVSRRGKEALVGILEAGNFFGEAVLTGQQIRTSIATTMEKCILVRLPTKEMRRILHKEPIFSGFFIAHLLSRNLRIEEDLVDQFFSSSEKRLARKLLLLARYGDEHDTPAKAIPTISQEALATMIGTTRSRVNFFMKKFQRLGFIDYTDGLKVKKSLLSVVLHD